MSLETRSKDAEDREVGLQLRQAGGEPAGDSAPREGLGNSTGPPREQRLR